VPDVLAGRATSATVTATNVASKNRLLLRFIFESKTKAKTKRRHSTPFSNHHWRKCALEGWIMHCRL
jgi:hypothetical protein